MAVANGTGTLTMNGQTYNIVVAHLSEVNAGGGIHSSLQMYDSYKPSLYLQGDFAITIQLDQTLETGTYTSDGTNVSVNHKDVGSYFLPQGTTYSVTRTGNIVSVSIEATNVTGNDIHGQPTTTTDISFNYSGSVYYFSYGI